MHKYIIIVAGGAGVRMGSIIPKQFMLLGGKPMLMHTINAFANCDLKDIIVVIPLPFIDYWQSLCKEYSFDVSHTTVAGGLFRSQSVKNGLSAIKEEEALVGIHDGVRPLISENLVNLAFQLAEEKGSAVPFIDLTDSIRFVDNEVNKSVDRDRYKLIQTPQCFSLSVLKQVYFTEQIHSFTDDAALVEEIGCTINLFKGSEENIKITTPLDMAIAETILSRRVKNIAPGNRI
jgi:2-C-methyl-D-erythritol 4-phosphate cytidylyltransferase